MPLKFAVSKKPPATILVSLSGTLDSKTSPELEREVDQLLLASPDTLVFDAKELEFISSAGLRVMAKAKKNLKKRAGSLLIVHMQPQIREVFDIVKALPPENIFASTEEMDDYLMARQHKKIQEEAVS